MLLLLHGGQALLHSRSCHYLDTTTWKNIQKEYMDNSKEFKYGLSSDFIGDILDDGYYTQLAREWEQAQGVSVGFLRISSTPCART